MPDAPLTFPILCLIAAFLFTVLRNLNECQRVILACYNTLRQSYARFKDRIFRRWSRLRESTDRDNESTLHYELIDHPDINEGSSDSASESYVENESPSADEHVQRVHGEDEDGWIDILVDKCVQRIKQHYEAGTETYESARGNMVSTEASTE